MENRKKIVIAGFAGFVVVAIAIIGVISCLIFGVNDSNTPVLSAGESNNRTVDSASDVSGGSLNSAGKGGEDGTREVSESGRSLADGGLTSVESGDGPVIDFSELSGGGSTDQGGDGQGADSLGDGDISDPNNTDTDVSADPGQGGSGEAAWGPIV